MKILPCLLALAAALPLSAFSECIVAGRLADAQWAPRFSGVQLLGAHGQVVASADKKLVSAVSQVRLARPALLSKCDGNNALANGDNEPAGKKEPVPSLAAGVFDVEAVTYPKLRTGGELVELRVRVPAGKVVVSAIN
ncbi:hypothetical protein LZ009_18675 [Ramlibacter sp. XY19]|uniref:hypothetical protein n=1 Tax=Ramlibacter paludis TaxID=2908000 RepID=UPI0023DB9917|nr:hypothetical protein [Ramlibacter paludis]MCG2594810.1 hypothetical protein [Ramlibacter paludis]